MAKTLMSFLMILLAWNISAQTEVPTAITPSASDAPIAAAGGLSTSANQPPVATNDPYTVSWGHTQVILWSTLLANDYDPDGDPIEVCDIGKPTHGTITSSGGGSTTYVAPSNCGLTSDTFKYVVCDDRGGRGVGFVEINLAGIICPPTS